MGIKVYGPIFSSGVARIVATLTEKGVTDFELVPVDLASGAQKQPEFLAINPFGHVPAMVDGSLKLFESRAVVRYIAHKYESQGTPLYGSTPEDAAIVEQWMEVEGQNLNAAFNGISAERMAKVNFMGTAPDESAVAIHVEKLSKLLDVYETHLTKNKYLAGDFFSAADLVHLPGLRALCGPYLKVGHVVDARPHVKAWYEDIKSRPSWANILGDIEEGMASLVARRKEQLAKQ